MGGGFTAAMGRKGLNPNVVSSFPSFGSGRKTLSAKNEKLNFDKWFSGSKVTNPDGSPMVMYHGTKESFNEFKATKFKDRLMFFSKDPEFASRWASGRQKKPEDLRNAKWTKENEKNLQEHWAEFYKTSDELYDKDKVAWSKQYDTLSKTQPPRRFKMEGESDAAVYPVYLKSENLFDPRKDYKLVEDTLRSIPGMSDVLKTGTHKEGNWAVYERKEIIDLIEELGFDGILLKESDLGNKHDTIAVWNPRQIKSAIGNKGTYNPNDPNILRSSAGVPTGILGVNREDEE